MNNILKFVFIYAASFLGLALAFTGTYLLINNLIISGDDWFQGTVLIALGVLLQVMVMVASTVGNTILLFDEILNKTTDLFELTLQQERNLQKRSASSSLPGMFNSVTIKNPTTGEETTTPLTSDNIADSINDINKAIIDSMLKGPQEPEETKKPKAKRRGRKKSLKNMNLGELESELAIAVEKDDYERAVEISTFIDLLKNPPSQEENKEE